MWSKLIVVQSLKVMTVLLLQVCLRTFTLKNTLLLGNYQLCSTQKLLQEQEYQNINVNNHYILELRNSQVTECSLN